jgi:hypothetical protein
MPSHPFSNPSFTSRLLVFYLSFTSRLPAPSDKPSTCRLAPPFEPSVNTATLQSPCINLYRSLFAARHFFVVAGSLSWLIATPTTEANGDWRIATGRRQRLATGDWRLVKRQQLATGN